MTGGAGAASGLQQLLADRLEQQKFAEDRRAQAAQEQRQADAAQLAREQFAFTQQQAKATGDRLATLDADARDTKLTREGVDLATMFPGKVVPGETMKRYPKFLQELIAKPRDSQLASREIAGFSQTAGSAPGGDLTTEDHDAVSPGSYELHLPISEKMRIASEQRAAAAAKGDKDREVSQQRIDEQRRHNEQIEALRAVGGAGGGRRRMTEGQEFSAIDKLNFRYNQNTKSQREIMENFARMDTAMEGINAGTVGLNAGTQAIVNSFNRVLEPGSVTRESEYARTPEGQALIARIQGKAEALVKGGPGLRPDDLNEFVTLARTFRGRAMRGIEAEKNRIKSYADKYDLPMDLIVADYDASAPSDHPATSGNPTATGSSAPTAAPGGASGGFRVTHVRPKR
jgi:hypothetical protein